MAYACCVRRPLREGSWAPIFSSFLPSMSRYSVRRGNPGDEARVGDADADEGASSSGWKAEIESITNGAAGRKKRRHLLCLR